VLLQELQGSLSGREAVQDIQPDLVCLEVKVKMSRNVKAACSPIATGPEQPSDQQALEGPMEHLSAQLVALQSRAAGASQPGQQSQFRGAAGSESRRELLS
jgi:hypothetical protein